ncbi:PKD domain-containing protein [Shewanella halifaxensis]|uniref:PKD domain-containing protein n=1 Tax=Shewanella halifaxensis TaxID=271098 RepID=UPI000D59DE56|nr:PKD domain-containing protein [Shewanella halifaxensis]
MKLSKLWVALSSVLILSACGGSDSNTTEQPTTEVSAAPNTKPVADAGTDLTMVLGETVSLNGNKSHDNDGDSLTYLWELVSQPTNSNITLDNTSVEFNFTPDIEGEYTIKLTVNDGEDSSEPDTLIISVEKPNAAPVATASEDTSIELGSSVTLDASGSSDPDGDLLTFKWELLSKPDASSYILEQSSTMSQTITLDAVGLYTFELTASDGELESKDQILITVEEKNYQPVGLVEAGIALPIGNETTLYGAYTDDNLSDVITYSWSFIQVPEASSLQSAIGTESYFSFYPDVAGKYQAQLIVNDGKVDSIPQNISIEIQERQELTFEVTNKNLYVTKPNQSVNIDFSDTLSLNGDKLQFSTHMKSGSGRISIGKSLIDPAQATFETTGTGAQVVTINANDGVNHASSNDVWIQVLPSSYDVFPVIKGQKIHYSKINETIEIDLSNQVLDIDGGDLYFQWREEHTPPLTDSIVLNDPKSAKQSLTISVPGVYYFMVAVSNNEDMTMKSEQAIVIYVSDNTMPIISDAGADLETTVNTIINLDGTNSTRYEEADEILWSITSSPYNSAASINDSNAISTTFTPDVKGRYVIQLSLIIDGKLYSGDTKVLQVSE